MVDVNDLVLVDDLKSDPRWPDFAGRTVDETGMLSLVTYRLYVSSQHRGALTFYSDWSYAFDHLAIATGAIFAAYASLLTSGIALGDEPVRRSRSQQVHREIGVAVGILMAAHGLNTTVAYQRLHEASRRLHRSLPATARHVVEHHALPDPDQQR